MILYPEISPVIFSVGPVSVHWYGLMYLIGFAGGWLMARYRAGRPDSGWTREQADDLIFYVGVGVILGGRIGYVLFYGTTQFMQDPLSIFRVWEGGMSFHGGFLGVLVAMVLFARKYGKTFFGTTDFIAPLIPLGLGAGRVGNFINGELWGRFTDMPWGVSLPCAGFPAYCQQLQPGTTWSMPVHPSQLYEGILEGLLLWLLLWVYSNRSRPVGAVSALFLIGYGIFRFAVEFVRLPDEHIGYLAFDWLTMGHVLTLPMIIAGLIILLLAYKGRFGKPVNEAIS